MELPSFRTALLVVSSPLESVTLRQALLKYGLERVVIAETKNEALTLLKQEPVDIILTPWDSPERLGRALLRELKQKGRHKKVPVLILDSGMTHHAAVAAIKAGAVGRVDMSAKSVRLQEMLDSVRAGWQEKIPP